MAVIEIASAQLETRKTELLSVVQSVLPVIALKDRRSVAYGYGSFFAFLQGLDGIASDRQFRTDSDADIAIFLSDFSSDMMRAAIGKSLGCCQHNLDIKYFDHYYPPYTTGWSFIQKISQHWLLLVKDSRIYF